MTHGVELAGEFTIALHDALPGERARVSQARRTLRSMTPRCVAGEPLDTLIEALQQVQWKKAS
jgi:hypothetical protein